MRIRRNPWLTHLLAGSLIVAATVTVQAQETTSTESSDSSSTGTSVKKTVFNLEPGDQLLYKTSGTALMSGGGKPQGQQEDMDIMTSLTVLEKKGDTVTIYAGLTANEQTTAGINQVPGPRFTFQMPLTGAENMQEFQKAGLSGTAFPTFSVESIFAAPAEEGKSTVSLAMPVTNSVEDGTAITTREGANLQTVATITKETTPVLTRKSVFSTEKHLTQSIETEVNLALSAQNMPISFTITDKTNLVGVKKLTAQEVGNLKADVESAIPIATKLQTLSMSSPDVIKSVLDDTNKYLDKYPEGEFAFIFRTLKEQLSKLVKQTANWDKIKKGAEAPDFTATTIDNKPIKLSDYKGKVVLIDFWATWCGPCMMELPNVKKLYAENKDKNFEIIGISADESLEDLQQVVEDKNIQWPQVFDKKESKSVQEVFGIMKYPTTILVDSEGKVSAIDLRGDALDEAVTKLLKDSK